MKGNCSKRSIFLVKIELQEDEKWIPNQFTSYPSPLTFLTTIWWYSHSTINFYVFSSYIYIYSIFMLTSRPWRIIQVSSFRAISQSLYSWLWLFKHNVLTKKIINKEKEKMIAFGKIHFYEFQYSIMGLDPWPWCLSQAQASRNGDWLGTMWL